MRFTSTISATLIMLCAATGLASPAMADDPPPGVDPAPPPPPQVFNVRYTVTADKPVNAEIYYRDTDPPTFSDYSHDPYVFSPPSVEATVGPNKPWVLEATLTDPIQWGMVLVQATGALPKAAAGFNCTMEINGQVVRQNSGPRGALCSIRNW